MKTKGGGPHNFKGGSVRKARNERLAEGVTVNTIKELAQLTGIWFTLAFGLVLGGGLAWTVLVLLWGWM